MDTCRTDKTRLVKSRQSRAERQASGASPQAAETRRYSGIPSREDCCCIARLDCQGQSSSTVVALVRSIFASVTAFDRHRVGRHEHVWSAEREDGRRCLDEDELRDAGMELDPRGRWRVALTQETQERLRSLAQQRAA